MTKNIKFQCDSRRHNLLVDVIFCCMDLRLYTTCIYVPRPALLHYFLNFCAKQTIHGRILIFFLLTLDWFTYKSTIVSNNIHVLGIVSSVKISLKIYFFLKAIIKTLMKNKNNKPK